jgi:hypothetical protein
MRTLRQCLVTTFVLILTMTEVAFIVPAAADWDEKYGLEGLTGERALYVGPENSCGFG